MDELMLSLSTLRDNAFGAQNQTVDDRFDKQLHNGRNPESGLLWGVGEMRGWRPTMEDAHLAMGSLSANNWSGTGLFAVFDGHGGAETARCCAQHLPHAIARGQTAEASDAIYDSFLEVDKVLSRTGAHDHVGCTAVACLISSENVTVANAGDSRAVLSRSGRAINLSMDHKPNLKAEASRIARAGGFVSEQHVGNHSVHRVCRDLAVSRAMGDFRFKKNANLPAKDQMVSGAPDIQSCKRHYDDEFIVIACDGVWDVLTSQEVVTRVSAHLGKIRCGQLQPADVVGMVLDECLAEDPTRSCGIGTDNMTMILVVFGNTAPKDPRSSLFGPCGSGGRGPATPCGCVAPRGRPAYPGGSKENLAVGQNQQDMPGSAGGSKPTSTGGCKEIPTVGQRAQVWRRDGSWSHCRVDAILPDGSVKVVIDGKDELKKILTQDEISRGFLKFRKRVGDSVPVPCIAFLQRG